MTSQERKALIILKDTTYYDREISASRFAKLMWPNSTMHVKVSNQGNGACAGKAAWLCAGSYLAKLIKKKWVNRGRYGYVITLEGKRLLLANHFQRQTAS